MPPPSGRRRGLLVFGDMHVLAHQRLLQALAKDAAELSRVLVSTHRNIELLQSSLSAGGLDGFIALPIDPSALTEQVHRLIERTRSLRFHYDGLRLALQDSFAERSP